MNTLMPRPRMLQPMGTDLFEEFDRLRGHLYDTLGVSAEGTANWTPALADLEETDDTFIVHVEVPGFAREDIKIEMQGRRLMVHAESEEQEREGVMRSSTRPRRHLHHEVILPADIDDEGAEAHLEHGVLNIRMQKQENSGRKRIEIA